MLRGFAVNPQEARALQERLARRVIRTDQWGPVRRVAGADVAFPRNTGEARAAVVVLGFPDLDLREWALAATAIPCPYMPGLLGFREAPAILAALRKLRRPPDLILCDGQGIAHPRRLGIASHLGVVTGLPTIGVAKSRLTGEHGPLGPDRGSRAPLMDGGEVVGVVLRTRSRVRPVFVSIGHRVSLEAAVSMVLRCTPRFRLPEPIRQAHRLAECA